MRQNAKRDSTPSMAPSGQTTRQKNRGMIRFRPTRVTSISPTTQAPANTRGSTAPGALCKKSMPAGKAASAPGLSATANERTSRQIGSSRPICSEPNRARTRKMVSPMYFSWKIGR